MSNSFNFSSHLFALFSITPEKLKTIFNNSHFSDKLLSLVDTNENWESACVKFYLELSAPNRERLLAGLTGQ